MLLLGDVRVHVAKGAVPSPEHSAAHVAPTLRLVQPATQLALLIGRVGTLGHSIGEHCPVGVNQLPVDKSQDAAGAGFGNVFPRQVAVQLLRPVQSGKLTAEEDEVGRPEQGRCVVGAVVLQLPATADQVPFAWHVELTVPKPLSHPTVQFVLISPLQPLNEAPVAVGCPRQLTGSVVTVTAVAVALSKTLVKLALTIASFTEASSSWTTVLSVLLLLLTMLFSVASKSLKVAFGGRDSTVGPPIASMRTFVAA